MRSSFAWFSSLGLTLTCGTWAAWVALAQEPTVTRDLVRIQVKAEDNPQLQLEAGGHTADILALAFTPDGQRVCSAGLDKKVEVWNLQGAARDLRRTFLRERTIRWQVARGPRGAIYALAVSPHDGLLAMAGYGAMGGTGEILLVDPLQGNLVRVLNTHRQAVASLSFSTDGQWLVSSDLAGQVIAWKRGDWQPLVLQSPDAQLYDAKTAAAIKASVQLRPVAVLGTRYAIVPRYDSVRKNGNLLWRLDWIEIATRKVVQSSPAWMDGAVTTLAASKDGKQLAAGDLVGRLLLFDATKPNSGVVLRTGSIPRAADFDPAGTRLVVGTLAAAKTPGEVEVWDVAKKQLLRKKTIGPNVTACAISPDGLRMAYTSSGFGVEVERIDQPIGTIEFKGGGRPIQRVAFAKGEPFYRIAWGTTAQPKGFNEYGPLEQSFDPVKLELGPAIDLPQAGEWITVASQSSGWSARPLADGRLQLAFNQQDQGFLPYQPMEGTYRSFCWIPGKDGRPFAIAAGTGLQNSILVYRLEAKGELPLVRRYRGHHGSVESLGCSHDGRFLVSGSNDSTIRIWSLEDLAAARPLYDRFGLAVASENGKAVVKEVEAAGPLHLKGVRPGDVITEIRWMTGTEVLSEKRSDAIIQQLATMPWNAQVAFETSRQGNPRDDFQSLPAWPALAHLFVDRRDEWAYWTPSGYYDASPNGHTLFGWLVNRGLEELPSFYRADQFQKRLERPDVLQQLFAAGDIVKAFELATAEPPAEFSSVLKMQIVSAPSIVILTPRAGTTLAQASTTVEAKVLVPKERELLGVRVYANGVSGRNRQVIGEQATPKGKEITYSWDLALPAEELNLVQVLAETDAPTSAHEHVVITQSKPSWPQEKPRLFVVSVGINEYADAAITPLSFSVADAEAVVAALEARTQTDYAFGGATILTNERVRASEWKASITAIAAKLSDKVQPNDLVVLFLAGHGFVDHETGTYYYASQDFSVEDYEARRFDGCLSWNDFQVFADIPCRKLAILDTCHSGAIQPLRSTGLKKAMRSLQDDVIFTLAASAGHERSAENPAWGHGAFTKCFLEGLAGKADVQGDHTVSLNEIIDYVNRAVPELTGDNQHPVAAPADFLPYVNLPLARGKAGGNK